MGRHIDGYGGHRHGEHTGYCTTGDGRDTKPFKFNNTKEGLDKFWDMIAVNKNRFVCSEVIVGYESAGPCAEPPVHYLMNKPVKIVQVNPVHTNEDERGKQQLSVKDRR